MLSYIKGSLKERYEALKQRTRALRDQRKEMSLDDQDVIMIIKGIKETLGEEDLKAVNPIIVKAVNVEPEG